ncbi:multidrug efflux MFS transporter NorA [Staphylococcus auricularis]|uniref:Multidrug efflux MFS transporter NorA n=1 Tax=Staphylococcus auricularis TaxID=29379 RepID=A0AAW7MFJ0_9STAP|nr:multidrug efflux MFS transporter NorA [Staphylococcus auricularis]MBM0868598.1 multidrug efflux MFS transporter NorA [Staphylococcus auricularis]MCG7341416.1 multidrug efflux MFS transporter NorA [Staphylococcus auricularis]MDC6327509.1 multidrug efflux MFS transporter NorA [Staphylococcus auricularis]MDN4534082.1 multidrug efflux MFS transporter NorA [Staphylococcus auricularis]HJE01554.1 multidrug efflux MFS transporter NorA [Staphylococcus auricularis]
MKKQLAILYFNIFLVFLGIGLVVPVLPVYLKDLGLKGGDLGILVAVFAFAQMIISPFGGNLADKLGKKLIIVIGLVLYAVSEYLFAMSNTFALLIISRILGGFSAGMVMPGVTGMIADISPGADKAKNFGYMSGIINTGYILGPGLGGFLAEFSHRLPFFVAGTSGVIALIMSVILLKNPRHETHAGFATISTETISKINLKVFITPVILTFVLAFGLSAFETLFPLYAADKADYSPIDISVAIMVGGVLGAFIQVFLFDKLMKFMSELNFIICALLYSIIVLFSLTLAHSYWPIMLISFIVFIGFDLIRPALTNYYSNIAGNRQGFAGGLNSTFTSMGNFVGPLIAGAVYDIYYELPLFMSMLIMVAGIIVIYIEKGVRRNLRKKNQLDE